MSTALPTMNELPRRRPRSAGLMFAALTVLLTVLLAVLALTTRQNPPPTIAEFAPQAIERITDPGESGSASGYGDVTGENADGIPTPLDALGAVDVARVRRCIGDPPRQIEDPQSPPCVPYWSGDNGGATSRGVTRDSIRVGGVYAGQTGRVLEAFFNSRFEFYGRRVLLTNLGGGGGSCEQQKAYAVQLAEQARLFANLDSNSAGAVCHYEELARRGVVAINAQQLVSEADDMRPLSPALWQYDMGMDEMMTAIGAMVCSRLVGHNAIHAGDAVFKLAQRKFGIVVQQPKADVPLPLSHLDRRLAQCGLNDVLTVSYGDDGGNGGSKYATDTQNAVLQMQAARVTTVLCFCAIFGELYIGPAATGQGYFPEWVISTYGGNDMNFLIKAFWSTEHRSALFGITTHNRQVRITEEPYYRALREVDPKLRMDEVTQLGTQYRAMLLLASGIQMAGPNLTPRSFERALHRTRFPNPDDPTLPAKVGFLRADHGMTDDAAEFWWSESAQGPDTSGTTPDGTPGALCYVDGGARRNPFAWPAEPDPFFSGECRSMG